MFVYPNRQQDCGPTFELNGAALIDPNGGYSKRLPPRPGSTRAAQAASAGARGWAAR